MTGQEIKMWRKSKKLSQAKLAELCHVQESTVANWELERNKPRGPAMALLEKLITGDASLVPLSPQEEKLLDKALQLADAVNREDLLSKLVLKLIRDGGTLLLVLSLTHCRTNPTSAHDETEKTKGEAACAKFTARPTPDASTHSLPALPFCYR